MSYNGKKKSQNQAADVSPSTGLELRPTQQPKEAHAAPLVDAQGLNPGPQLMTPGGAPLDQYVYIAAQPIL